ncbi:cysteine hydrolase family protein [Sphaerisporangium perillae]|uniref:cysteine hydrolase family protein n=1 Tax=Sphaerisporangium perillae TaxID=2935860 RepID=UPI00200CEF19|nr:cysteine hydrolase family protein [Sphaerisporangium perillae]
MSENNVMVTVEDNAALVVIDVQKGFEAAYWGRRDNPDAEENIAALIRKWRAEERPIVVVRHDSHTPGSPLEPGTPGNELKDVVTEALGADAPDLLVTKTVNSAFYGEPDLGGWLRDHGVQQIVIIGIQTNMCNETTARMAGNLGYRVLYPIDAMHTFDAVGPDGEVVTAEDLTRATAASLHHGRFARVVRTADLLRVPAPA